jgi:hypothetical protein
MPSVDLSGHTFRYRPFHTHPHQQTQQQQSIHAWSFDSADHTAVVPLLLLLLLLPVPHDGHTGNTSFVLLYCMDPRLYSLHGWCAIYGQPLAQLLLASAHQSVRIQYQQQHQRRQYETTELME